MKPTLALPAWMSAGLCAQTDPDEFFPEKGGSTREAKKVCLACEVRTDCLNYALTNDERFGVWGGLSERERRQLRSPGVGRPHEPADCGTEAAYRRHQRHGEVIDEDCEEAYQAAYTARNAARAVARAAQRAAAA